MTKTRKLKNDADKILREHIAQIKESIKFMRAEIKRKTALLKLLEKRAKLL